MKLKPYSSYISTLFPWLSPLPSHWQFKRIKHCVSLVNQKTDSAAVDLPYTGLEHIESWTGRRLTDPGLMEESEGQSNLYLEGDVLFGKLRPYLAKVLRADSSGICTGELLVLRPSLVDQSFLFYFMLSRDTITLVNSSTYGAKMPRANWDFIGNLPISIPPLPEQRAIAAFLDRETKRIDLLISKKQKQIELLQKKRASLISQVVTKGLDSKAKMKDSGVDWLGIVPEKWKVIKLKYLLDGNVVNGLFKKGDSFGTGVKLVNVFDVYRKDFFVDQGSLDRVEADLPEQTKYSVLPGDIFFVRSSLKLEGVGRSACALSVDEPTVFECHVVRARPNKDLINPKFLIHFLNSCCAINRFISLANLVTMATIDQDKIKSIEIPLPSLAEQNEIMAHLGHMLSAIETLELKIQLGIGKLHVYRTALISAAVTGKIDVRNEMEIPA